MSVACGLECVFCLGCSRWAWKRLTYVGNYDSELWPPAALEDFEPVPRMCRAILSIYEEDLAHPRFLPNDDAGGEGGGGSVHTVDPSWVVKHVNYDQIPDGLFPPYIIYADPVHRELVFAVRGLNLAREADYKVLMDNRLGREMFGGGFVHHGLLQAASALLTRESEMLAQKLTELGPDYKLVFAGHSLGAGIVALMTMVVVNHLDKLGGIPRSRVKCYCIAPARCGRYPPEVKTAIPVEGRFEHIVLSCNTTSDHAIIWIEREAQKALKIMKENAEPTSPPLQQKMDRKQSLQKEHKDALVKALSLTGPHAVELTEESYDVTIIEHPERSNGDSKTSGTNWDELIERLFTRSKSGNFAVKKDLNIRD